jgi:D-threo-aldose 1-dehydrogenase
MTEEAATATADAAYQAGVRYVDTAPLYGHGLSEHRVGTQLRRLKDPEIVLSTKVGWRLKPAFGRTIEDSLFRDLPPFLLELDYSYDGVMRSFEDSMQRLNTDRIDILLIHDCDRRNQGDAYPQRFREAMDGAYKAILNLREQGLVKAIGCGLNEWEACQDFLEAGDFDCFLLAGRYTLLDQDSLNSFLPLCETRKVGIILGGPYNSGILATGARPGAFYNYAPATDAILRKCAAIEAVCARHAVPLKAAALQFPLHHPCITTVIPGMRDRAEIEENLRLLRHPIPAAFYAELKAEGLLHPAAPVTTG